MKRRVLITILSILMYSLYGVAQVNFNGLWGGAIKSGEFEIEVNFKVETEANRVLLTVPLQKINDQIGSGITIKGDSIHFDYSSFNASYRGVYDSESQEIKGEWAQGKKTSLNLKRISKKSKIRRSQKVKRPFSYTYKSFKFPNKEAGIELGATLTIPEGEGPFPLAVLVSGSGPQDRNSEILDHKPFLVIADHLSSNGVAVLRYDDRGVKSSGGNYTQSTSADFATDAAAAISYGRSLPQIDSTKVGIIGHSEGGLIAPKVAAEYQSLDFIVSIAGPAVPITELMTSQNKLILEKKGMSAEGLEILEERLPPIYGIVNQDMEPKELFDTLAREVKSFYNALPEKDQQLMGASSTAYYTAISSTFFSTWFRYFLAYDPGPSWQQVTCPVLAINGSEDIQVSAKENLAAIKKNLEIAGNTNHREIELEGLNHLMQPCKACNIKEYALIEITFDPKVLQLITEFIQEL